MALWIFSGHSKTIEYFNPKLVGIPINHEFFTKATPIVSYLMRRIPLPRHIFPLPLPPLDPPTIHVECCGITLPKWSAATFVGFCTACVLPGAAQLPKWSAATFHPLLGMPRKGEPFWGPWTKRRHLWFPPRRGAGCISSGGTTIDAGFPPKL